MGVQRIPQKSLMELIGGQQGKSAPAQIVPSQVSSLPARSPPPVPHHPPQSSPQPAPPSTATQEKRREQKGKGVADASKSRHTREEDVQRAAKQQKTRQPSTRGQEKSNSPHPDSQAWLPVPMLGEEPLRNDASVRDYNGSIGCHVASAVEEALLLPKDMAELKNVRKNQLILDNKRYLGMDLTVVRKKLQVEEEARKRAESSSEGYQKQAEEQAKLLREANAELKKTREQVLVLKKHLEETQRLRERAEKLKEQAEKAKIESEKALNAAGVEASSELRKPENVYYPEAIRSSTPQPHQADIPAPAVNPSEEALPRSSSPGASPSKSTIASKTYTVSQGFQQELDSTVQSAGGIIKE
ncbi:centrosomal protein of 164 kDa-like [Quercus lobata]|uniref:centrosomal protein of 164 kDa-like n=1 Tax=Quercus lobata TaxID=97700 RepID=UPI001249441B|nr:centrosomal protein of 164 kDa-like [Quercus lobata]